CRRSTRSGRRSPGRGPRSPVSSNPPGARGAALEWRQYIGASSAQSVLLHAELTVRIATLPGRTSACVSGRGRGSMLFKILLLIAFMTPIVLVAAGALVHSIDRPPVE